MALTGRFDFRKTLTGKIVLRIEEEVPRSWPWSGERRTKKRWRDAALIDLSAPEMRRLIDLRFSSHAKTYRVDVERTSASTGTAG